MARLVLLWVKKNEKVDKLTEELNSRKGVRVVGLFAEPTSFCDPSECGRPTGEGAYRTHPALFSERHGTHHCPLCKKVIRVPHMNMRNLLDPVGLHHSMRDLRLTIKLPDDGSMWSGRSALEIYGEEAVAAGIRALKNTQAALKRYKEEKSTRTEKTARRRARRKAR